MTQTSMTRPRSGTRATSRATPAAMNATGKQGISPQNVLFYGGDWIGLAANNQYGFDVLAQHNGQYESIVNDPKQLMEAFKWHLQQDGLLKGGASSGAGSAGVARRTVAKASTAGGIAQTGDGAATRSRTGRNTSSRTSIRRTQTPALNTGASQNSG